MGDADRAVGGVDRLAAGAGRAVDVDPQVRVVDLDVDLLGLGQHRDGRRRGVDAAAALGHRHALDAVDAAFELQPREHALRRRPRRSPPCSRRARPRSPRSARTASPWPRHSAGTCATGRRRTSAASSPPVPARISSIAARSSAASRGSSFSASARSASGSCACSSASSSARHLADARRVGIVRASRSSDLDLGAQPPHLARRLGDRLDLGIILGERTNCVGREIAAPTSPVCSSSAPRLDGGDPFGGDSGSLLAVSAFVETGDRDSRRCSPTSAEVLTVSLAARQLVDRR